MRSNYYEWEGNTYLFKFPVRKLIEVDFPNKIDFEGKTYHITGKFGNKIENNIPSAEYQNCENKLDCRIWLDATGEITKD